MSYLFLSQSSFYPFLPLLSSSSLKSLVLLITTRICVASQLTLALTPWLHADVTANLGEVEKPTEKERMDYKKHPVHVGL